MAALPAAHLVLGAVLEAKSDLSGAAASYASALSAAGGADVADAATAEWASAVAHSYAVLTRCAAAPKPAWWTDATLLSLSERVLELLAEQLNAQTMRAELLSGLQGALPELAAPRSAEELRTAAAAYQKVLALS